MEALTEQWFDAPDPPFVPAGQYFGPRAHLDTVNDIARTDDGVLGRKQA